MKSMKLLLLAALTMGTFAASISNADPMIARQNVDCYLTTLENTDQVLTCHLPSGAVITTEVSEKDGVTKAQVKDVYQRRDHAAREN